MNNNVLPFISLLLIWILYSCKARVAHVHHLLSDCSSWVRVMESLVWSCYLLPCLGYSFTAQRVFHLRPALTV